MICKIRLILFDLNKLGDIQDYAKYIYHKKEIKLNTCHKNAILATILDIA